MWMYVCGCPLFPYTHTHSHSLALIHTNTQTRAHTYTHTHTHINTGSDGGCPARIEGKGGREEKRIGGGVGGMGVEEEEEEVTFQLDLITTIISTKYRHIINIYIKQTSLI